MSYIPPSLVFLVLTFTPLSTSYQPSTTCVSPRVQINGTRLEFHRPQVTSYVFKVETNSSPQYCKLVCQAGSWRGPYCGDSPHGVTEDVYKYGCKFSTVPPGLEIRQGHSLLDLSSSVQLPHSSTLLVRCQDQTDQQSGPATLECQDGHWSHNLPTCRATASAGDYSDSRPPRIQYSVSGSSWTVGRVGQVIVQPGAIVHLDCLADRRRGNPSWRWTNLYKEFPTGWVIHSSKRNSHYRLSIIYAKLEDSGRFNCSTPRGQHNSLAIIVTRLSCPLLHTSDTLRVNTSNTNIGTVVSFSCPTGFVLLGEATHECRDDGTWSSPVSPSCRPVQCPPLEISSSHLRVLKLNNSYLGSATFSCPLGYRLPAQSSTIWCTREGVWSGSVPDCEAVVCTPPSPPLYGSVVTSGDTRVGSTVQSVCDDGFVLIGEPVNRCTEDGVWSHPIPFCKRACRYPGPQAGGDITPVRFLYSVGDRIAVICHHGYVSMGSSTVHCTDAGEWSSIIPQCIDYK